MNDVLRVLLLSIIGAIIGWTTNIVAIKLIFRPLNPINIFGYKFQGVIPKRKTEIAKSIGDIIEDELLSIDEIVDKALEEGNITPIKEKLKLKINKIVEQKLPSIIPNTFKIKIYSYVDDLVEKEGERIIVDFIENIVNSPNQKISISKIVEDKINDFELQKIEKIILSISSRELKHIEVLGGVLGFIIGIVQGIIVILI
ncbi:putative membrane protein [Gottschalkia purinilytica]|uniref:Putative membrane protein n=1 Tax=Gottschalkia purinilytica TaxID=1503 RepID=A0A0L0W890_GOTPU|nr:DUF445 family protein [Gottschalkia purinilytica]KNF07480.1 putative membrane protein [Gottschalkia purinilytica]